MKCHYIFVIALLIATGCASQQSVTPGDWLMIVPPLNSNGQPDTSQPLPKWQIIATFASQVDCNTSLNQRKFNLQTWLGPISSSQNSPQAMAVKVLNGQCVLKDKVQG
jgi:hypothetical protein